MKMNCLKQVLDTKRVNKEMKRGSGFRLLGNKSMLNRYGVISKCLGLEEFTHWTIPLPQQFVKFIALIGQSRENYFAPFLPHKCPIMAHCCRTKGGSNREIKTETSCDQIENLSSPPSHSTIVCALASVLSTHFFSLFNCSQTKRSKAAQWSTTSSAMCTGKVERPCHTMLCLIMYCGPFCNDNFFLQVLTS